MTKTSTSAQHGYSARKGEILKRLARIEGQVRGVARMVADDRYCIDVLTQISAVQNAFDSVALELLDDHVRHCVIESRGGQTDRAHRRADGGRRPPRQDALNTGRLHLISAMKVVDEL
jgi:DNA-binding FrmR family transcriptional regulator